METIAQEAKSGWQPIDTAPKDGTIFLGLVSGSHAKTGKPYEPGRAYWSSQFETWCEAGEKEEDGLWELTHWFPIPPLP